MNKQEFLNILKDYLSGQISDQDIRMQIGYYSDYIDSRISSGYSEAEVLNELGDPRLIGKTIVETNKASGSAYENRDGGSGSSYDDSYNNSSYNSQGDSQNGSQNPPRGCFFDTSTLIGKIKLIALIVIVVAVLFVLIRFAVRLFTIILPVLIVLFVIMSIWKRR